MSRFSTVLCTLYLNGFLEFENESWSVRLSLVISDVVDVCHRPLPLNLPQLLDDVILQISLHDPGPRHDEVHGECHPQEAGHLLCSNNCPILNWVVMSRFPCKLIFSSPSSLALTLASKHCSSQLKTGDSLPLCTWNCGGLARATVACLLDISNKMHLSQFSI